MPKTVVEKFSFIELKIEKVKFFTESPTQIFCISVFNVGGARSKLLNFKTIFNVRPFLTYQLGCLFFLKNMYNQLISNKLRTYCDSNLAILEARHKQHIFEKCNRNTAKAFMFLSSTKKSVHLTQGWIVTTRDGVIRKRRR